MTARPSALNELALPRYGFPKEWELINEKFPNLQAGLCAFFQSATTIICGSRSTASVAQRVVHFLGNACLEDFNEILLLGFNGFGIGAQKLLRGLYERTITEAYLANHPEETRRFLDFGDVQMWRVLDAAKHDFGEDIALTKEQLDEARAAFEKVKDQFLLKSECCGADTLAGSWKSHYTLAKKGRPPHLKKDEAWLDSFVFAYYQLPTMQLHTTRHSISSRLADTPEGGLRFKGEAQQREAIDAMRAAHHLALASLEIQNRFFSLDRKVEVDERSRDFLPMWKLDGPEAPPENPEVE